MHEINMKYIQLKKHQQGLTLIELLVAAFLGLMLLGVIGSMYLTSSKGFRSTNELSLVQENTRFALHFLNKEISQAGYSECGINVTQDISFLEGSENSTFGGALFGWEFQSTDIGDPTYALNYADVRDATLAEIALASASNSASPVELNSAILPPDDPNTPATETIVLDDFITLNEPIRGSDVIAVVREEEMDIEVNAETMPGSDTISVTAASETLPQRAIVKVGDCYRRDIFSKTNLSTTPGLQAAEGNGNVPRLATATTPGRNSRLTSGLADDTAFFTKRWGAANTVSNVYNDVTTLFYVGTGASGIPALFRIRSRCGFEFAACEPGSFETVELVEGVENMQILYGVDLNQDGIADQYYSADEVPAPVDAYNYNGAGLSNGIDVVNVKVSLLMRSIERSAATNTDGETYTLLDNIVIDPPDDGSFRYVINSTIELRNRAE